MQNLSISFSMKDCHLCGEAKMISFRSSWTGPYSKSEIISSKLSITYAMPNQFRFSGPMLSCLFVCGSTRLGSESFKSWWLRRTSLLRAESGHGNSFSSRYSSKIQAVKELCHIQWTSVLVRAKRPFPSQSGVLIEVLCVSRSARQ
jgi:hypothetical protein